MPIPYQLFTYRNRKSSNQIPSEIKLEGWLISYWYHLYGYSVLIKVLGSKAYLVVPVDSKTIKLEVLEIVDVTQLLAYPLIVQGSEIESLDFSCVECEFQRVVDAAGYVFNIKLM